MGMPPPQAEQYFTYDDYLNWPDDERWEIIEGRAYALAPAPTRRHQHISGTLYYLLRQFFEGKPVYVFHGPLDVRLPNLNEPNAPVDTVVQPDLLVVCDPSKLDDRSIVGAPDLIIEILSESTTHRDLDLKLRLYEKHGVRCYIIVDPWGKTLTVRYLDSNGRYTLPQLFAGPVQMPIRIFAGLILDVEKVFEGI